MCVGGVRGHGRKQPFDNFEGVGAELSTWTGIGGQAEGRGQGRGRRRLVLWRLRGPLLGVLEFTHSRCTERSLCVSSGKGCGLT